MDEETLYKKRKGLGELVRLFRYLDINELLVKYSKNPDFIKFGILRDIQDINETEDTTKVIGNGLEIPTCEDEGHYGEETII